MNIRTFSNNMKTEMKDQRRAHKNEHTNGGHP